MKSYANINELFGFEHRAAIREAFEISTMKENRFAVAIMCTDWDETFWADDEFYFTKGDWTLTTPSLDPFKIGKSWRPAFMVGAEVFEF